MYAFRVDVSLLLSILVLIHIIIPRSGVSYNQFILSVSLACVFWAYAMKWKEEEQRIAPILVAIGGFAMLGLGYFY